jgi:hypothetical protein
MDVPPGLQITMNDIRRAGYCPHVQDFFRGRGIYDDLRVLVKGGSMPAERLLATGDPREDVVRKKLEREGMARG